MQVSQGWAGPAKICRFCKNVQVLKGEMAAGEPLMQQAMDAMRRYHEARDSLTDAEEVDRLRLEAESLMQAFSEYQQAVLGGPAATRH